MSVLAPSTEWYHIFRFVACRHSEEVKKHGDKYYMQSLTKMSFERASDFCHDKFMSLATMNDLESFNNVFAFMGMNSLHIIESGSI